RPRHLGRFGPEGEGQTQALVHCQGRLILVGPGCLSVFDVSDPARPRHLGTSRPPGYSWNGCGVGDRLYVAEALIPSFKGSSAGFAVFALADPGPLKEAGFGATPATAYHLLPIGKDQLAALMDNRAQLSSTAAPLKPVALGPPVATSARSGVAF